MTSIDWLTLSITLLFIIFYGIIKSRKDTNIEGYLLGNKSMPWYNVGFSVMATQASAITFLSAPGQGFNDGMRFVQFYLGLPLAMVVLCITFVPIFHRLRVYTAYEYLENRFDARVRVFTSFLFLIQRGLSTGISIYAPSIILSTIFGWNIFYTNIIMGGIVLSYTVIGGTKAISYTHLQQMLIITAVLFLAAIMLVKMLPPEIGFIDALKIAGKENKMNLINFQFNPQDRYNIWSGLIGGFFLQLSYFGTDQSQVGRYLTGESISQSRLGLIMNGLLKIPMQFCILLIGVLVFVFYQYNPSPIFFNKVETDKLSQSQYAGTFSELQKQHTELNIKKQYITKKLIQNIDNKDVEIYKKNIEQIENDDKAIKAKVTDLIKKNNPASDPNDINYIFLRFILDHIPHGLIGLLIAVIFSASMGSLASAYNSLASCSVIDIYRKIAKQPLTESHELRASKVFTIIWGIFCIIVAQFATNLGSSMIELVNILGSWFYGVILGIFLVAFYCKSIGGKSVFYAAIVAQILVIIIWEFDYVAYLWLNPIGCLLVIGLAYFFEMFLGNFYIKTLPHKS